MTLTEIKIVLDEAHAQAAGIAQSKGDGEMRTLAIAIAETARATAALARLIG